MILFLNDHETSPSVLGIVVVFLNLLEIAVNLGRVAVVAVLLELLLVAIRFVIVLLRGLGRGIVGRGGLRARRPTTQRSRIRALRGDRRRRCSRCWRGRGTGGKGSGVLILELIAVVIAFGLVVVGRRFHRRRWGC